MLNIKVQRLKCYRNKKIKTEKLRNTNMLDKCRNITLAENRWHYLTGNIKCFMSLSLQKSQRMPILNTPNCSL